MYNSHIIVLINGTDHIKRVFTRFERKRKEKNTFIKLDENKNDRYGQKENRQKDLKSYSGMILHIIKLEQLIKIVSIHHNRCPFNGIW